MSSNPVHIFFVRHLHVFKIVLFFIIENSFHSRFSSLRIWPRGHQRWDFLKSQISQNIWVFLTKVCHQTYFSSNSELSLSIFSKIWDFSQMFVPPTFFQPPLRNKSWDFSENVETGRFELFFVKLAPLVTYIFHDVFICLTFQYTVWI